MNKKVYVVVPVYNVAKLLPRCLESIKNQNYENFEVIIVDDGSTDDCPRICDKYQEENENFVCIHKENGGLSDARNAGLDYCFEHEPDPDNVYITFVDSDDFLSPDYLKKCVDICCEYDCQMVQCGYERGEADHFSSERGKEQVSVVSSDRALLGYVLKSQACAKLYRMSLFRDERFRKGVWNEDEFITYRIVDKCSRVAFTDARLYYYYQRENSIMSDIANKLKDIGYQNDWLTAYMERESYFARKGKHQHVLKTYEKICTDIILRYTEQMKNTKENRLDSVSLQLYLGIYRKYYRQAIKKKYMPLHRRIIYTVFYLFPYSSVLASKFSALRK